MARYAYLDDRKFEVVDERGGEVCTLQEFAFATQPRQRVLRLWSRRDAWDRIDPPAPATADCPNNG